MYALASPSLALSARQLITLYSRRMQIELSFRDLKSHRYGQGFEDSLTRKGARIEALLLLSAMAAFASWLVGTACEASGIDAWLAPFRSKRRLYSVMRLGREAFVRRWSSTRLNELIETRPGILAGDPVQLNPGLAPQFPVGRHRLAYGLPFPRNLHNVTDGHLQFF